MALTCEYCSGPNQDGAVKCAACGAPLPQIQAQATVADLRSCPACHRKLLTLGSASCNYCGHRLPDEMVKVREAELRRINDTNQDDKKAINAKLDEVLSQNRFQTRRSSTRIDIFDLTDLF